MLIEDFFEAVDRAFIQEAGRTPAPRRLELGTPSLLPLSAPESPQTAPSMERRRQPERCRLPERRYHGYYFPPEELLSRTKEGRIRGE
jgi:hypothetical protein